MLTVSVIMSVYKEPIDWMKQAIDSILNQTFTDFEFIIVNDNPDREDNNKVLNEYASKDSRIRIITNETNIGLTKSLNKALTVAKGKYIARMDADDESMPSRFAEQFKYMEENDDVVVLGTDVYYMGKHASLFNLLQVSKVGDENLKAKLIAVSCFYHPSVFIRKSILDKNNILYDEEYRTGQDYRLWEMLLPYGRFEKLGMKLLKYRLSEQQITKSKSQNERNLSSNIRYRIQKRWLDTTGINYSDSDLISNPIKVLSLLRKKSDIRKLPEYKMYVEYVYSDSGENLGIWDLLITGDVFHLPYQVVLLFLIKRIKGIIVTA